jgi:hypothetical protein
VSTEIECTQPATEYIEIYSPRNGLAHGSLDATVYTCAEHRAWTVDAIHAARLTAYAATYTPTFPGGDRHRCGHRFDYTQRITERESTQ